MLHTSERWPSPRELFGPAVEKAAGPRALGAARTAGSAPGRAEARFGDLGLEGRRALEAIDSSFDHALRTPAHHYRARIRAFLLSRGGIALRRECSKGHLTASCLLWANGGDRVLLHHHKKLDLWLQFGGHCDGEGDLAAVARRETLEESGIEPAWVSPTPIDFDVHEIPARAATKRRAAEPRHLHLDVRYTALAPVGAVPVQSEESLALAWLTPEEALARGADESLRRLLGLGPPDPR